jgi:hypothetical protein
MNTITNEVAEKEFEPYYLIEETADADDYGSVFGKLAKTLDWEEDEDLEIETSFKEGPLLKRRADAFKYMLDQRMSDKWVDPKKDLSYDYPLLLKLHGSTNWLTSYLRPDGNTLKSLQETPIDDFYIYESTSKPYSTYNGRFMSGYDDYSYGYYPPNLPLLGEKIPDDYLLVTNTITLEGMPEATSSLEGLVSMPLG